MVDIEELTGKYIISPYPSGDAVVRVMGCKIEDILEDRVIFHLRAKVMTGEYKGELDTLSFQAFKSDGYRIGISSNEIYDDFNIAVLRL